MLFKKRKTFHLPHLLHYSLLALVILLAFVFRTYRTQDLLRFYYDQGRDALVVFDMINVPKPVLVGPTTGLAGILRGPFFYYLLLPAYLIGQGSPVIAAIWLQIINFFGLIFIYLCAKELFSRRAGLIAVFILGFSNEFVSLSRWLSNPSPILTTVPIMLYGLIQIIKEKKQHFWWPVVALMLGLNLQLEIASEFFFIIALFLFLIFNRQFWPKTKTLLISAGVFLSTLIPQIAFDFRHEHIMYKAILSHFASPGEPSFAFVWENILSRWNFFVDSFSLILIPQVYWPTITAFVLSIILYFTSKKFRLPKVKVLYYLIFIPLLILSFYQGNEGNFYSYYLIGIYPLAVILLSGILSKLFFFPVLFAFPWIFLILFGSTNLTLVDNFLAAGYDGPEHITLGNQLQAIDWIYQRADGREFNIDFYVPPMIPYSYDYLILWYGDKEYGYQPKEEQRELLYTLSEVDPPHPQRLQAWLDRQSHIGEVKKLERFGGILVEERKRYE